MSRPSKVMVIAVLLASNWLTAYQIDDAAEDTLEDLTRAAQINSSPGTHFSNPLAPDDDDDADMPNIANQTLPPGAIAFVPQLHASGFSTPPLCGLALASIEVTQQGLSPPSITAVHDEALARRQSHLAAAYRTLAPPAA